ncbi:MAG: hypothetical protein ACJ8J0_05615, partial [Longimicrobiaceae bacterium]
MGIEELHAVGMAGKQRESLAIRPRDESPGVRVLNHGGRAFRPGRHPSQGFQKAAVPVESPESPAAEQPRAQDHSVAGPDCLERELIAAQRNRSVTYRGRILSQVDMNQPLELAIVDPEFRAPGQRVDAPWVTEFARPGTLSAKRAHADSVRPADDVYRGAGVAVEHDQVFADHRHCPGTAQQVVFEE